MKKVLFAAATAISMLAVGCSTSEPMGVLEAEEGALTVSIKNEGNKGSRASGDPTQDLENTVHNFAVYVFNGTDGTLEKSQVFDSGLTGTITGLRTTPAKRIVVLVNYNFNVVGPITEYDDLNDGTLNIESQYPQDFSTDGLFMSGELSNVNLVGGQNTVTIGVKRVVAKVKLATLTVSPDASSELNQFILRGASMQKVPYWAYMLGDMIPDLDPTEYYGGLAGQVSSIVTINPDLLNEAYTPTIVAGETLTPQIYFYVFPNDNSLGYATLLTLYGTYNGQDAYYTFPINDKVGAGTDTSDGTYIKRNMIYSLNITLRALSNHASDPDEQLADVTVTVNVSNWDGELIQTVEW